jgi:DNA polymerase elongation subunit (family B)
VNGEKFSKTGAEWHKFLFENNLAISAFGTVFNQNKIAMVADTLTYWFNERLRLNAEKKKYGKLAEAEQDPIKRAEYEKLVEHYDLLQLTKKIQLNSTYGALLNEAFRFGRREIGASVTGTGRQITKFMGETIGYLVTGKKCEFEKRYDYDVDYSGDGDMYSKNSAAFAQMVKRKDYDSLRRLPLIAIKVMNQKTQEMEQSPAVWFTENEGIIYGDTDSCYFQTFATNYDEAVLVADTVAEQTNAQFPDFMSRAFNCTGGRETYIKAAREIVGEAGLFLMAKKKYTIKVVNLDGKDLRAKPKLKSMGSEIKKADTPKIIQDFLKKLMNLVLDLEPYDVLEKFVNTNRKGLIRKTDDVLGLGAAKQVNNLDSYYAEYQKVEKPGKGKCKLPGHVRAAVNYNELVQEFAPGSKLLHAGDKVIVFYLKKNHRGLKSIGFPSDIMSLPSWFTEEFQVDLALTEEKMIDSKLEGIFEALDWEVPTPQRALLNSIFEM